MSTESDWCESNNQSAVQGQATGWDFYQIHLPSRTSLHYFNVNFCSYRYHTMLAFVWYKSQPVAWPCTADWLLLSHQSDSVDISTRPSILFSYHYVLCTFSVYYHTSSILYNPDHNNQFISVRKLLTLHISYWHPAASYTLHIITTSLLLSESYFSFIFCTGMTYQLE